MPAAYIETYGCSANQNNGEIAAGLLGQAGFDIVLNKSQADLAVLLSCVVKGPTVQRMASRIKELSSLPLVVAGCMPAYDAKTIEKLAPKASLLGPSNLTKIAKVAKATFLGKKVKLVKPAREEKLLLPKVRQNRVIGITQISEGCLGNCSYCAVRLCKGGLRSYEADKIVKNVKIDLKAGCKEIWLTSQDSAAYGAGEGKRELPSLLRSILSLRGNFFVRLGMVNPDSVLPILDDLLTLYKSKKMYKFLHLPLQSGSDKVLAAMNRRYKAKDFLEIVDRFRASFPRSTIATDVICGFPGESESDFAKTLSVLRETKPDVVHINRFWPMKRTKAAEFSFDAELAKERSKKVRQLVDEMAEEKEKRGTWLDWRGLCLVNKKGYEQTWLARNEAYKLIVLRSEKNLLGSFVNVRIVRETAYFLFGQLE